MSELDVIDVAATHRIKFSVGWEKDPDEPRSSEREVRAGSPTAGSRCSGRCRSRAYAAAEVEFADAGVPGAAAGCRVVFVHMPKRRPIGIEGCHCIVAPAAGAGLRAAATEHDRFTLTEVTWGISGEAPGVTNRGELAGAGCGIANCRVSVRIHSYAGHPAE